MSMENEFVRDWCSHFKSSSDWAEVLNALHQFGFSDAELDDFSQRGVPFGKLYMLILDGLIDNKVKPGREKEYVREMFP